MASFTMFEIVIEVDAKLVYDGSSIENAGLAVLSSHIVVSYFLNPEARILDLLSSFKYQWRTFLLVVPFTTAETVKILSPFAVTFFLRII
ncbi:hypothetical protein CMV_000873 [Castanea mollissima]|uniref:Uncharacterized protein n=1 Tax=Castanea mollissima TaxID=60419 RepID=A0A8J4RYV0_9ROSI|nr:hypothetical protein CMV_000873 [Castanea mollissima]